MDRHLQNEAKEFSSADSCYEALKRENSFSFQDILDHITGPVISIAVHVILLTLLATFFVGTKLEPKQDDFIVDLVKFEDKIVPLKELLKPQELPDELSDPDSVKIDEPDINNPTPDTPSPDPSPAENTSEVPVLAPELSNISICENFSSKQLPIFSNRTPEGLKKGIHDYGPKNIPGIKITGTIDLGLKWLASHQNEDGSWGATAGVQPALTSLAMLALMAHGDSPNSPKYGPHITKGLRKLVDYAFNADEKGLIRNSGNGYGHAMVGYALAESYSLFHVPQTEAAMAKVLRTLMNGQNILGSYNYAYQNNPASIDPQTGKVIGGEIAGEPRCDLSVAGWNFQALKAAYMAGFSQDQALAQAIEKALSALEKIHACEKGGFNYSRGTKGQSSSESMTAVGTLCMQLFGCGNRAAAQKGLKLLEEGFTAGDAKNDLEMDWEHAPRWALYTWYYKTQALFMGHKGTGPVWNKWSSSFTDRLIKEQAKDGHWVSPAEKYGEKKLDTKSGKLIGQEESVGSGSLQQELDVQVYATALCSLMLQVYIRYLPSTKIVTQEENPGKKISDDLDITIE
ncbi:MAG: hypothetical protein A2X49_16450 [Lentisphaerae bacterium GWF2_52_8]|nr:MAG: hypothetical protein A2X49_16450 [Lentisphaerae bacterium GWF2_52_8]